MLIMRHGQCRMVWADVVWQRLSSALTGQAINSQVTRVRWKDGSHVNAWQGTDSDSNILKIYRLLDRSNGIDKHYYQVRHRKAPSSARKLSDIAWDWHICQYQVHVAYQPSIPAQLVVSKSQRLGRGNVIRCSCNGRYESMTTPSLIGAPI